MEKQAVILATLASKRKKKLSDRKRWRQWSSESFREYPIIEQGLKSQLPKWNWTETNSTIILSDSFIKLEDYPILVMPSHPSALTYLHILSYWFWRSENRLENLHYLPWLYQCLPSLFKFFIMSSVEVNAIIFAPKGLNGGDRSAAALNH